MTAITVILPIFTLILLGGILRRAMHFSEEFWAQLDRLIYFVLIPCLFINSLLAEPLQLRAALPMLGVGLLFTLCGIVLAGIGMGFLGAPRATAAAAFQCGFRFNAYVGLGVIGALHGKPGLASMGLLAGVLVPLVNVASVWVLARHSETHLLRQLATNPLILATVTGLVLGIGEIPVPATLLKVFALLAQAALPIGLISVGANLYLTGFHRHPPTLIYGTCVKLLVLPMVALGLAWSFGLTGISRDTVVVLAALPASTAAYVLAKRMGADGEIMAAQICLTTLLSMLTIPTWVWLLGRMA